MKTPQGEAADVTAIDKGTLAVRTREIKQGPDGDQRWRSTARKATGTVAMGGQPQPVVGGPRRSALRRRPRRVPFDRRAAAEGRLHGHVSQLRRDEAEGRRSSRLKVVGIEDVTVPAGTFKAWKVEIKSADGEPGDQTVWVDSTSRRIVKIIATLPDMGGAVATMELQK